MEVEENRQTKRLKSRKEVEVAEEEVGGIYIQEREAEVEGRELGVGRRMKVSSEES